MNIIANKNILSSFIQECVEKKDDAKLRVVLQKMKNNKMLSEAYFAIDNLQFGVVKENIREYVVDHINILKRNKKGLNLIEKCNNVYATEIDKDIEYLMNNSKTAKNYQLWESKVFNITSYIEHRTEIASKKIDRAALLESIQQLPENHKEIIKQLTLAENKKSFYEDFKRECLLKINTLLKEEDNNNHKLLLYEVKEQVNNLNYDEKKYVKDIVKINRINEMLSE